MRVLAQSFSWSDSSTGLAAAVAVYWLVGIVLAIPCANIWKNKGGSPGVGFLAGLLLGVIGLVIVATATPSAMRECPYCKSRIPVDAVVCRHCQRESEPWHRLKHVWVRLDEQGKELWLDTSTGAWHRVRRGDRCPYCGASMRPETKVCGRCQKRSSSQIEGEPFPRATATGGDLPPPPPPS